MLDALIETIAEIIYENELIYLVQLCNELGISKFIEEREYKAWGELDTDNQDHYTGVAEEVIELIQENTHLFED